ncbi:MAG: hypothetical protein H0U63_04610 [Burkholderiales bacterium]|nr:hypothetical protein [Burkholderiales bacterium]
MMESLDTILRGGSNATPEGSTESSVAQPVMAEAEVPQETESPSSEVEGDGRQRMVPHEALHAEKQKVKRYTEEVADFRKQLSETNAAWERRMSELVQAVRPKQEPAPRPDFFENPEAATQFAVQSQVSPQFDQITQHLQSMAKDNAITRFTEETVDTAEQAFLSAMQSQKLDPADYQKVVSSPNRYAAAVQWHKRQLAQAEIGDDPAAYRTKLEAEIREKVLAEVHGGGQQQEQRSQVMPSNLVGARNVGSRSGPAWGGQASINDIFARKRGAS